MGGMGVKAGADWTERYQELIELHAERKWHGCELIYDLLQHIGRNVSNLEVGDIAWQKNSFNFLTLPQAPNQPDHF